MHAISCLDDLKNHLMDVYAFDILIEIQYISITVTIAEFLFIFFFQFYRDIIDIQQCISLCILHSDLIYTHCKMVITISMVTIHHFI